MALKSRTISTLIESQLPEFISSEYEQFSLLLEKYYEQLEIQGQPLDIIHNITKYRDINFYEKNLLNQFTTLVQNADIDDTTIVVSDASSFPDKNGYIRIGNEICFYKEKKETLDNNNNKVWNLVEVSRGISGNTKLGDLYESTTFVTSEAQEHFVGDTVYNVSNLFLYAIIKSFEADYLDPFPEKYLKQNLDKRNLIKNIKKFYRSKGSESSVRFIFNTIVSQDVTNVPQVYNPKDYTLKSSTSDWITKYSLKVKLLSGNPEELIGQQITQRSPSFASAIVDNVIYIGTYADEDLYELILEPSSINSNFTVPAKTTLTKSLTASTGEGSRINVVSTFGWNTTGSILIGSERITFNDKNVNQFIIESRLGTRGTYNSGTPVYDDITISTNDVSFIILGILYNLNVKNGAPYSNTGDKIEISEPGFDTKDPIIYDKLNDRYRWLINENNTAPSIPQNLSVQESVSDLNANVSAIYEDEQYYYVCSSGFPSHQILKSGITQTLKDQKFLKLIRKYPTTVTEVYKTSTRDTGIFVDGTVAMSYKDEDYVDFGRITKINVTDKGFGYKSAPYVLINDAPGKAECQLSGEVVESVSILTEESFNSIPTVTITSGRNGIVDAIVTQGRVTSLVIVDPGEYYSSPPIIRISDKAGKGRLAEYRAKISFEGKIIDFEKVDEGRFYSQENIVVEVIPEGRNASAKAEIVRWVKNRFKKLENNLDDSYGYVFLNYDQNKEYGYGRVANPVRLREFLDDNLTNTFQETQEKAHSPILGFAYDGNPIYGPYGYEDPTNPSSPIIRLQSGYTQKVSRPNGPSTTQYPLGTFIDDYVWTPSVQSGKTILDKNNGRYCVTPEYPEGTYAYFITINSSNVPVFPYIIGENFYSLPVDSNYNSPISQDDLPSTVKRLKSSVLNYNGGGVIANIDVITSGSINGVIVEDSPKSFNVGNRLVFNNSGTNGSNASAFVSSVTGETVTSLRSKNTVIKIDTIENAYIFDGDFIQQESTNAIGKIVGNTFNEKTIFLEEVQGSFNLQNKLNCKNSSNQLVKVLNLILDQNSTFTKDAIISLTDGLNNPNSIIATGQILEPTTNQNSVKVKVLTGDFIINEDYFLRSSDLSNTPGSKIFSISSLSQQLTPFSVNKNIALAKTSVPHNLAVGDVVNVDINPNDQTTETTFYVRKRAYQEVNLIPFNFESILIDSGVGRVDILNRGFNYTSGSYQNVELIFLDPKKSRKTIGKEGDTSNAKATVVVTNGKIASITITQKGANYKKGDVLTIKDSRLFNNSSTSLAAIFVDHAGLSANETTIKLRSVNGLSEEDYIKIGSEIIKITQVNLSNNTVSVTRAQENTSAEDHFNLQSVSIHNPVYRFNEDYYPLESGNNSPFVYSFDQKNNKIIFAYAYSSTNPQRIVESNVFYDNSFPQKLISISSVTPVVNKLEFSKDTENNFVINPTLDIQNYYSYKFDTSHSSMLQTYLDFSPSLNENIFTEEKTVSNIEPGNSGAFVKLKLGFGPLINSNNFDVKKNLRFNNYYYFIVANNVDTNNSSLRVIDDPLIGTKSLIFVTTDKFLYEVDREPQYQGSGTISYTTNSQFALGKIHEVRIDNSGVSYEYVPAIDGVYVAESNEATLDVIYDSINTEIVSVKVVSGGQGYIKPKVVVSNSFDYGARFNVYQENGVIKRVDVINKGFGFKYLPELKVIETAVKVYATSNNIGVPKNVKIINNGGGFYKDNSILSTYRSSYTLILSNFNDYDFSQGEEIVQTTVINNVIAETVKARVAKNGFRPGSNLLKLENVEGEFDKNLPIFGKSGNKTATIKAILFTEFSPDIRSYADNLGYYGSDRGKIGSGTQKLTDSYFYQDYSYVIKSKTAIDVWRDLIKQTTHPAGFKLFGEMVVESEGKTNTPISQRPAEKISIINLAPKSVKVIGTKQNITQTLLRVSNSNVERGIGSVRVDSFNSSETLASSIRLDSPFDGAYDQDTGKIVGKRTFTIIDQKTNTPLQVYNENQLIICLDGVIQEPKVAYTVENNRITFATAPLGERVVEGQKIAAQSFIGRSIRFKNNTLNNRYLRKIRNIFQRSGVWLDSANQIRFNKNFIVEETIGYVKEKYPNVNWNRLEGKCKRDIAYILDAIEHDIRFGGNTKTVNYAELYFTRGGEIDFIVDELQETIDAFRYAINLSVAAIRNWDVTFVNDGLNNQVSITAGSKIVTVPSTVGIAVGMNISSGKQFPLGTKVTKILSATQVELSNPAFDEIGDIYLPLDINEEVTYTVPSDADQIFGTILVEGTLQVNLGGIISSRRSIPSVSQITFYFSKINTGTFYDASNLIESNKLYIQEETIGKIKQEYPLFNIPNESKCIRDLGYYIDAVVHHLRYGGNKKIIEFAHAYYDNNRLKFINNELQQSLRAYEYATELMARAMRNDLPTNGTFTDIVPFSDNNILPDIDLPACQEVESTLLSYYDSVNTMLTIGKNLVPVSPENAQGSGNWTLLPTYSNYSLTNDVPIFNTECQEVVSSLLSLFDVIETTLTQGKNSVDLSAPDYFNGENKVFDLYYEDGSIVKTDANENLLVSMSGILQRLSVTEDNVDSYHILRSENPNVPDKIVFSVAPKWEQDDNAINLQEATAVEKFFAVTLGSYETYTINNNLIRYVGKGPYSIISRKSGKIKSVDNDYYALVFIDGVLQNQSESYSITGTSIAFSEALNYYISESGEITYPKVDIVVFYGRDLDKTATFYDFEPDTYYNKIELFLFGEDTFNQFKAFYTNAELANTDKIVYQQYNNKTYVIGKIKGYEVLDDSRWKMIISGNNAIFDENSSIFIGVDGRLSDINYNVQITNDLIVPAGTTFTVPSNEDYYYGIITVEDTGTLVVEGTGTITSTTFELTYAKDDEGNRIVRRDASAWLYETNRGDETWKKNSRLYANLGEGDLIQIDGENDYRQIVKLPEIVKSKNFNIGDTVSNNIYGTVKVTNYDDIVRGEGLAITARILNGKVTKLIWNRRDLNLYFNQNILLQPSAYQYFSPPIIDFIPVDESGGGARAEVIVVGGQIVDIVLVDGGSGYTEPPKVIISRGYNRIKQSRRKVDSFQILKLQPNVLDCSTLITSTSVNIIAGTPAIQTIVSELFVTPLNSDRTITSIITPESSIVNIEYSKTDVSTVVLPKINVDSIVSTSRVLTNIVETTLNTISTTTIEDTSREIVIQPKITITDAITQSPLATVNDLGAFLDIDLSPTDTVVYIPNTRNFPDTGRLLIGKEIVFYSRKLPDRFLGVLRGQYGTQATSHEAGDYLRLLADTVSVVPTNVVQIYSECIVTQTHNTSLEVVVTVSTNLVNIQSFSITNTLSIENTIETGFTDEPNVNKDKYEAFTLGSNLRSYQDFAFIDVGINQVSGDMIETFNLFYPDMTIEDFEKGNIDSTYYGTTRFISTLATINHYGAFLDGTLGELDTVINVTNTGGFPNSGKLLVGTEIVTYNGKTPTSFINVTRAQDNTAVYTHVSGEYLRTV